MNIHFYFQFRGSILSDTKIHTLRKKAIKSGTQAALVIYPYSKTKREVLKIVTIIKSVPLRIDADEKVILYQNTPLSLEGINEFSKNEGFSTVDDFWVYIQNHQMSKKTIFCIMWKPFNYLRYLLI